MTHFLNTLEQIVRSESVTPVRGILRHSEWQLRKLFRKFPCELPIANSHLYVDRPGGVAALVNAMGEYDYNNMELLRLILSSVHGTFFDVGANIGAYTLIASESPNTHVVSIEPHPSTFALLQLNVELNARRNVLCLNLALSDNDGDAPLSDYSESAINRVLKPGETEEPNLLVPCRRLDTLCYELGLAPTFLKIDVEGYEEAVLEGFGELASDAKLIFIERGDCLELRSVLQHAGQNGPWFFHFRQRRFSKERQARPEDPVYFSPDFIFTLRELGLAIG
jgi:FkbM family methyltransferase